MDRLRPARKRELALVMPVYNEAECLTEVVSGWSGVLAGLGIDFEILVLDDGSTDGTRGKLEAFRVDNRVIPVFRKHSGHGPAVLEGYKLAVARAEWVFQADGDNEVPPESFAALWSARAGFDALFGERVARRQPIRRKVVSALAMLAVRALFGGKVRDVNTPYRLIRSGALASAIARIPDTAFAPNLLVTGMLAAMKARVSTMPVPYVRRRTGEGSLGGAKLWKAAARSLAQCVSFRISSAGAPGER